jgi:hypothetical protein
VDRTLRRGVGGRRNFERSLERHALMSVGDAFQSVLKSLTAVRQMSHHLKEPFFGSMADGADHGSANSEFMRDGRDNSTARKAPASVDDVAHVLLFPFSLSAGRRKVNSEPPILLVRRSR